MGVNTAFCLVIFGILGVYSEFVWPGRVWQGVLGAAAAATGGYFLLRAEPSHSALVFLAVALVLFLLDAYLDTRFIAGVLGTCVLVYGFLRLIREPHRIHPALVLLWCVALGGVTVWLNWAARRARRNKRALDDY